MSTTAALSERTVRAVLLALWQGNDGGVGRPSGDITLQHLLQKTLAPLPDIQQSFDQLAARGCRIERTAGVPATVRLVSTGIGCWPDILQHQAARDSLSIGRRAIAFQMTPSTNDMAWQAGDGPENHGLVVVADEQSAGRGRRGNTWLAKPQQSVLMSVLLVDQSGGASTGNIDRLTLLAGLAAACAIETAAAREGAPVHIQIKWPNDLLIDHRKVAGILVERRGHATVIGIGINVAQAQGDFPPDLEARATSLYQATGMLMDRLRVAAAVAKSLDHYLAGAATPSDDAWLDDWKRRCHMLGQRLRVRSDNRIIEGQVLDVHPLQGLLLRDDSGVTHFLSAQTATVEVP